ncbi:MAG: flavin reductase (DIM6/NTAB) family NADH-FMN oxidoreductase RutF [Oceanicoccus sp.]|jgi:flavin reductase (DIM6/NTAB) family NADH-FMN oxidoreductase RutF
MSLESCDLRSALGHFTTGVCVVTANFKGGTPYGLTVNSFASVSLEPALVLWSLQNDSDCIAVFEGAEKFAINILAADQKDMSTIYASKGNHVLAPEHCRLGKYGAPILRGSVASFECNSWAKYPGGDHQIFVGEVMAIETNTNKKPLLFNSGQYRELR